DEIKTVLQDSATFRTRQVLDPKREFGDDGMGNGDVGPLGGGQTRDDRGIALHQSGNGVRVEHEGHRSRGGFERRAFVTSVNRPSTAAAVSPSTERSFSRNSGAQPARSSSACSS